jgi:hypothetical protein
MKSIKNSLKNILYAVPFGMKGANDEILAPKDSSTNDNVGIVEVKEDKSLKDALLRGEVTQEVEELRWRLYHVEEESQKYKYVGNGITDKAETDDNKTKAINIYQENEQLGDTILDTLNEVGVDVKDKTYQEKYLFDIEYINQPSRFNLPKHILSLNLTNKEVSLTFPGVSSVMQPQTRQVVNEVISEMDFKEKYGMFKRKDISCLNNIKQLTFHTHNCEGDVNFVKYTLSNLEMINIEKVAYEYIITYTVGDIERVDPKDIFLSKSMEEKYKNNEPKIKRNIIIK